VAAASNAERAERFLARHGTPGGFVLPNVWDAGSARIVEQVGFDAIATTSAGIAFASGKPDGAMERGPMLEAVARIVASVDVPVSADLEAGYGATPDEVAATIADAASIGVVGANLEDLRPGGGLFPVEEAVDRLTAVRSAAPTGTFVLNARTDTYLSRSPSGEPDDLFAETVARAERYVAAGADCIFVPGVDDADTIRRLVEAIPAPLNVVAGLTANVLDAATLGGLGVARISVGGSLARATLGYVERAAEAMRTDGTFAFTADAIPHTDLQHRFS
jgi:2-methylisocitrate lyase-like PEP mutase family enzyme